MREGLREVKDGIADVRSSLLPSADDAVEASGGVWSAQLVEVAIATANAALG